MLHQASDHIIMYVYCPTGLSGTVQRAVVCLVGYVYCAFINCNQLVVFSMCSYVRTNKIYESPCLRTNQKGTTADRDPQIRIMRRKRDAGIMEPAYYVSPPFPGLPYIIYFISAQLPYE